MLLDERKSIFCVLQVQKWIEWLIKYNLFIRGDSLGYVEELAPTIHSLKPTIDQLYIPLRPSSHYFSSI